ncbi:MULTISPECIES: type VI secretion system baseplate subunit TssG [unclassified Paraburkholderia]|uniref:type VI secretion system baseplate subunit TssG n=1 Tax=unclassified Paraburkholderia TaxID=2615204 RepID=UPI002AB13ACD|nr:MULTISPECIES: type VI secretion system baseplate subunit TssG [unclassified Paraburkholderia]
MAADDGQPARTLAQQLYAQPHAFEFAQAIRLLELLSPDATPLGTGLDPRREALMLSGTLSPVFPASAIGPLRARAPRSLALDDDAREPHCSPDADSLPQLQVNAFALGGPNGPLPGAWQEWIQDRLRRKDTSALAFLDLFQHRLLALLYRAQRKYRSADPYPLHSQRAADPVLRAITGLAWHRDDETPTVEAQTADNDSDSGNRSERGTLLRAVLARAGMFANQRRSLAGFDAMLRHHFDIDARSTPFVGGWRALPAASRTTVGHAGRNRTLGAGAIVGTRVWDEHRGIRVTIGPLARAQYEAFLPGGDSHGAFQALADAWFGAELYVHVELRLAAGQLATAHLSRAAPPRLGWTAWAGAGDTAPARLTRLAPAAAVRSANAAPG